MVIHLLSPQCFPTTEPPDTDLSSVLRLWPCYQPPLPFGREAVTVTGRMDKSTCLEESDQQSSKLCSKICT